MKNLAFPMLACLMAMYATPCFSEIRTYTDETTGNVSVLSIFPNTVFYDSVLEGSRSAGAITFFRKDDSDEYLLRLSGSENLMDASLDSFPKASIFIDKIIFALPFHGSSSTVETNYESIVTGYSEYLISSEVKEKLMHAKSVWIEMRPKLESPIRWKILPEMLKEWKEVLLKNSATSP